MGKLKQERDAAREELHVLKVTTSLTSLHFLVKRRDPILDFEVLLLILCLIKVCSFQTGPSHLFNCL